MDKYVLLYEEWALFGCLVGCSMYTMYVEVHTHTGDMPVLCTGTFTWKWLIGKFYNRGIYLDRQTSDQNPRTSHERKCNFLLHDVFAFQVPKISCHIIRTVGYLSINNYILFFLWIQTRERFRPCFLYMENFKMKRNKKGITPRIKMEVKKYEKQLVQTLSRKKIVVAPS